jgi:hypothetical protein
MGKRARQDSAGHFLSRINAADILKGDIGGQGSYIEGRIHAKSPRNNHYSIDVRPPNPKAKPVYLDVFIADKLQRRLEELSVGDHLRILLEGAQLLPYSGSSSHLSVTLRFNEGITVLLMSRAGLQGEKETLFSIWPGSSEYSILVSAGSNHLLAQRQVRPRKESRDSTSITPMWDGSPRRLKAIKLLERRPSPPEDPI